MAAGVDLAIDQERRHARLLGIGDGSDARVRAGVVEDDGLGAAGHGRVDELVLLGGVVVVAEHERVVAELLRLGLGAVGLRLEEGVVERRRDDGDQVLGLGRPDGRETGDRHACGDHRAMERLH